LKAKNAFKAINVFKQGAAPGRPGKGSIQAQFQNNCQLAPTIVGKKALALPLLSTRW
jgi:hypothetical protein